MALRGLALALLGLLAYQNRDKIGDFLRQQGKPLSPGNTRPGGSTGGSPLDDMISGSGIREVLDRFRKAGAGEEVDSWVSRGENRPIGRDQVERAIDPQTLQALSEQTGLTKDELIERIVRDLPAAVDNVTPAGQLPPEGDNPSEPTLLDDVPPSRTQG